MDYLGFSRNILSFKHNQWKTRSELESLQEERLRKIVAHASENTAHYGQHERIRDLGDLPSLTITRKQDIRADPDSFISKGFKKESLLKVPTSGSSGVPLIAYFDRNEITYGSSLGMHMLNEAGFGPFDQQVHVTYRKGRQGFLSKFLFRSRNVTMEGDAKKTLFGIKSLKPDIIRSYPSFLALLAHANIELGIKLKKVFSYSELLSPKTRRLISGSFGCAVKDFYGTNEVYAVAWECEKGSMHINSDSIIVEVVDDAGRPLKDGQTGRILLTSLWRRSMPFIRYDIGDIGSLGTRCRCGRGLHVLKSLEGRSDDFLIGPSGRIFSSHIILPVLRVMDGILQFQVIQEQPGSILIRIIPTGKIDKQKMIRELHPILPEKMEILIEPVEKLPHGPTGKVKAVISRCKVDL